MTYQINGLTQDRHEDWDRFVNQQRDATFFHLAGWQSVIERSFGHRTYYLYAERDGIIAGVLPLVHVKSKLFGNALIANAFCVAGGPLSDDVEAGQALQDKATEILSDTGAEYIEYRNPASVPRDWKVKDSLYANFSREIEKAEDANLKQIPRKQRAVVRKALKNDALGFRLDDDISDFYHLYATSVRNLGTPVYGKKFFSNLRDVFGDDCEILTITAEGVPVSSVLSFYFRDQVLPYYTGSATTARRLGSNDLMYWRVMRRAAEMGKTIFDFGRSKVDTGPYAFKKNWGFEPVPIVHAFCLRDGVEVPDINPLNPKYALMVATWKRLPLPVANLIGPHIVRNIG